MQRFRKILVGIDLAVSDRLMDPTGHATRDSLALAKATWLARATGAELRLATVVPVRSRAAALDRRSQRTGDRSLVAGAERRLRELAVGAAGGDVRTSTCARVGAPVVQLLDEAARWQADLIVVGGDGDESSASQNSVAAEVFRAADAPVWVARRGVPRSLRHVLAAVALDEHSHGVLRLAASFAERVGARLSVLHAVEGTETVDRADIARHAVEAWVRAHAPATRLGEIRIERGDAAAHIVAVADRLPADVVMIGPSNRSRLTAFLSGRPSSRLFGAVACSLVCARQIPDLAGQDWRTASAEPTVAVLSR